MAEFAQLNSEGKTSFGENDLGLSNPDSVLAGTMRGVQNLGSPNLKVDSANSRLTVNDNVTNRVIFGRIGSGTNDWGLKVSKPNVDVTSAASTDLIFNSSQNVFKIVASGTSSLTGSNSISSGTTQTVTVAHGLGFSPIPIVYGNAPNGGLGGFQGGNGIQNLPIHYMISGSTGGKPWFWIQSRVDSSNIYFDLVCVGGTGNDLSAFTWSFKYYLLQETAN